MKTEKKPESVPCHTGNSAYAYALLLVVGVALAGLVYLTLAPAVAQAFEPLQWLLGGGK